MRDPRHDILFEPVQIGPVTTKNRFYQVPHCSGMGRQRPRTLAAMRGVKAEGGWGVVCTEYCSIHPTSDDSIYPYATFWDEHDIKALALMTEAVHEHGALAGVELWLAGGYVANIDTRLPSIGLQSRPSGRVFPVQGRRMDKTDIRNMRQWQADAARRAVQAGFDIVYVYATHGYLLSEFLDGAINKRTDEYGGSLENRTRIVRELVDVTREAVAGKCGVATRFSVDLSRPESYDAFALLADLPDLWDLTVDDYAVEMGASRFVKEGALQDSVAKARALTVRPVVAVGRFTSPDTMTQVVKDGTQDLIGAARPSIADPFLPKKIEEGRIEDIRECIGCNICYAYNASGVPIRCTQNPTMGEEWRAGWHPERIAATTQRERVLVIGAGPAGLEAARVLGERGYRVMLAEASRTPGGRVGKESRLPGLSEWSRVKDWRLGQIDKLSNVEVYLESHMSAADALDVEPDHIVVATGARWAVDGLGRYPDAPFECAAGARIFSADTVLDGDDTPPGRVVIFDDDHYYLGPVLAMALRGRGNEVVLLTAAGRICGWGAYTEEQHASYAALLERGVEIVTNRSLKSVESGCARVSCVFSVRETAITADWVLPLTRREPNDALYYEILDAATTPPKSIRRIGDCEAPGMIVAAVYSGYRAGIEIDTTPAPLERELPMSLRDS